MTLTPWDMLEIQSAIDAYEKRFHRKPSATAADALAWQTGKRGRELRSDGCSRNRSDECGALTWARESFLLWWLVDAAPAFGSLFSLKRDGAGGAR